MAQLRSETATGLKSRTKKRRSGPVAAGLGRSARRNDSSSAAKGRIRKDREAQILRAAEEVFAEFGYDGTTTREVAERARLPKANVHYYFETKADLYQAVLADILALWLEPFDNIDPDSDPATALEFYIRAKVAYSRERPSASKVFANEIIRGAPVIGGYLRTQLKRWTDDKAEIIRNWARKGEIDNHDPYLLLFAIWSMTQHYADFDAQVGAILGRPLRTEADFKRIADFTVDFIFKACGLRRPKVGKRGGKA